MTPLVGDLAPPHRRATALSIVSSAMMSGLLIARLLSGIVTDFVNWRVIYWIAFGLQYGILILLWFFMPDYPSTNPGGLNYFRMLFSIIQMVFKHPVLVQACLMGFFASAIFTCYWTTLTGLLSASPYNYSSLNIGLFALIGIGAMCLATPYSRFVIDRYVPLFSVILGACITMVGLVVGISIGTWNVAGPIIQGFAIDLGLQSAQIANRSAIYAIEPKARNRVNTAYMISVFCGQLMGTAAGNTIFAQHGWIGSDAASIGFLGAAILVCLARGPWEKGWIGWTGGWGFQKKKVGNTVQQQPEEEPVAVEGQHDEEKGLPGVSPEFDVAGEKFKNNVTDPTFGAPQPFATTAEELSEKTLPHHVPEANEETNVTDKRMNTAVDGGDGVDDSKRG